MSSGSTENKETDAASGLVSRASDRLAAIVWADAHSIDSEEWKPLKDHNLHDGDYLVVSVGWMLPEAESKKDHIVIYQSRTPDEDLDAVLCIPREMIRTIQFLETYVGRPRS